MRTKLATKLVLFALLTVCTTLSGCTWHKVVIHPLAPWQFDTLKKGQAYEVPTDGYFVDEGTMKDMFDAQVQQAKKK